MFNKSLSATPEFKLMKCFGKALRWGLAAARSKQDWKLGTLSLTPTTSGWGGGLAMEFNNQWPMLSSIPPM